MIIYFCLGSDAGVTGKDSDKIRNVQGGVAADEGGLSSTVDDNFPPTGDGGVTYW